ncbi:hypothetical protein EDC94DRAFT_612516 [Helicostylum pulchrum]|nr:hypothetical protein EDC94DRAFT_612516 [Helicostylum pulchrum]
MGYTAGYSKNVTTDTLIGFYCTLFQMMLLADGIYMRVAINCFSLIEESHHLVKLPSIVEAFLFY